MSSDAVPGWLRVWTKWTLFACAASGIILYACWPRVDHRALLDRQIEEQWMAGRETMDAFEFFAKGGLYVSDDRPAAKDLDRNHVIPLIETLRDKHHLKVVVILNDDAPGTALAVLAESPADRKTRNAVRATILDAADKFPGLALQNWSHQWVSLDFLPEDIVERMHPGTRERIKAGQRRME